MPKAGYIYIMGALKARRVFVTHKRLREAVRRVDPSRYLDPELLAVPRRIKYHSPYPNGCWHYDGNHKLVRWGFVITGCVDGFSRRIMWLKVVTNNKSGTLLNIFKEAIDRHGVPDKTRCDKGGENVKVSACKFLKRIRSNSL